MKEHTAMVDYVCTDKKCLKNSGSRIKLRNFDIFNGPESYIKSLPKMLKCTVCGKPSKKGKVIVNKEIGEIKYGMGRT